MTTANPTLGKFILHTLLWLPPCFAAWYFSAQHHAAVVGALARVLIDLFKSGLVTAVEQPGIKLVFETAIEMPIAPEQYAVLTPEVNPLLYTYGLAFFIALMLAARAKWWKILAGAALLIPFQSWGIAFGFLVQVGILLGPAVSAQAGLSGGQTEIIALGYQIGSLIFPSLIPIVLWVLFNRTFIENLLSSQAHSAHPRLQ